MDGNLSISMPPKEKPPMQQVFTRLPQELVSELEAICDREGIERAALVRNLIVDGLAVYCERLSKRLEYENKMLVNRKLKLSLGELEEKPTEDKR